MKDILTIDRKVVADAVWEAVRCNVDVAAGASLLKVEGFDDRWCIYLPDEAPQSKQDALYYYGLGVYDGMKAWRLVDEEG